MSLQRFLERLIWLCMLPLIIMGSVLLLLHLHTLNERRQMLVDSVVRAAASSLDQMLEVRLSSLALLGRMLEEPALIHEGRLNLQRAHEFCAEYWRLHENHVLIGSATGEMLINTRLSFGQPLPPLPEVHQRSAVTLALTGKAPAVGDPFMGPIAGVPLVALAVPLKVKQQPPLVLLTTVETAQLRQRLAKNFNLPEGWILRLHTSTGSEVFRIPEPASDETNEVPHQAGSGPWRAASLSRAPWTVALMAPPVSPLDNGVVRALLLVNTLVATIALAYWGARTAAMRLTRAMGTLTRTTATPHSTADIQEVTAVKAELVRLDRERLMAQEAERRRIGLELHDDLQQKLALIRQDLSFEPPDAVRDRRLSWVDELIASTRRLVQDLRPPVLQEVGLPTALTALASQHQTTHGQAVDVSSDDGEQWAELPEGSALALYRVAQEALNNARKHANAEAVHINLSGLLGGEVVMEVADDGVGFDFETSIQQIGNGLRGMQERLQALGGQLDVITEPGAGTALVARLPWPPREEGKAPADTAR